MKIIIFIFSLMFFFSCTKKKNLDSRVLNLEIIGEIGGFDPAVNFDVPSAAQISNIYEPLFEYHRFKNPKEIVPNLAETLPAYSSDGLTITIKIKNGILFQDDKAFPNGKGRELVAEDVVYTIKRIADTKNISIIWSWIDNRIVGLNQWRDHNSKLEKTDYALPVEGLKALDKNTLQIKLIAPYPQLIHLLAAPFLAVVAKEVVDFYGKEFMNHPVGTGPYRLKEYVPSSIIKFEKNPTFREKYYPAESSADLKDKMSDAGKKLPLISEINVHVLKERSAAWLKFLNKEIDMVFIPKDTFSIAINENDLAKDLKEKGISLHKINEPNLVFVGMNHEIKIFQNKKLRQALLAAIDSKKYIDLFTNGTGLNAHSGLAPGQPGYDEKFLNTYKGLNLELAKKLLSEAGYPDGKGLPTLEFDVFDSTSTRQQAEFYTQQFEKIGVKLKANLSPWPKFLEKLNTGKVQMFAVGYLAIYPDSQIFFQSLYSKNIGSTNAIKYSNPEYDKMYERIATMMDSPERTKLYEQMNQFIAEEVPMLFMIHRVDYHLTHKRLENMHPYYGGFNYFAYLDIAE